MFQFIQIIKYEYCSKFDLPIYQFNMQLLVLKVRCMLEALNTQHQSYS